METRVAIIGIIVEDRNKNKDSIERLNNILHVVSSPAHKYGYNPFIFIRNP